MTQQLIAQRRQKVVVDIVWAMLILVAFIVFAYLGTYLDLYPSVADKGDYGFGILIGSMVGTFLLVGYDADTFFSFSEFLQGSFMIVVSLIAIVIVNNAVPFKILAIAPIGSAMFSMMIGIAEESMFRGFILTLILNMTGNPIIAIAVSSLMGAVFHAAIYGASEATIMIVFGCFAVLGFCYIASGRRLSVTMAAHCLINLLAFMG